MQLGLRGPGATGGAEMHRERALPRFSITQSCTHLQAVRLFFVLARHTRPEIAPLESEDEPARTRQRRKCQQGNGEGGSNPRNYSEKEEKLGDPTLARHF